MEITQSDFVDKDYSLEMQDLIKKESAQQEKTLPRNIMDHGELGAAVQQLRPASSREFTTVSGDMLQILSKQAGLPYVHLNDYKVGGPEILKLIPAQLARTYKVFPLRFEPDGSLLLAISDPLNITIVDDLRLLLEKNITPVVAGEDDIMDNIDLYYGMGDETIEKMVEEFEKEDTGTIELVSAGEMDLSDLERIANEPPVIKLVNLLLIQAIKDRASDLHVEPFGGMLRIRYRVDGVLREIPSPPKSLQLGLCSRLKVMANLNISETRLPQDGRIRLTIQGREVDLRISTVPTVHGESIVMRILDKSMMMLGVSQIGMTKEVMERFLKIIHKPNGIVLCTGPTGCGKTTTLYSALNEINNPEDKIITTEDPVEYEVPGIIQINVNAKVGLTFAACLRSILRQDPDIILVGEIRDLETAQTAIQASLTGHLVFSTLHTNSAAGTITRLVDMGVEPFLITSTLEAVVGQRLVRTICPNCKRPYMPSAQELEDFGVLPEEVADVEFFKGIGCDDCSYTGYKGRMGIFELLEITEEIRDLILRRASTDEIQAMALHQGMSTMRQDGWLKICLGMTTFDEVARQTPQESKEQIAEEMERVIRETLERVEASKKGMTLEEMKAKEQQETLTPSAPESAPQQVSEPVYEAMPEQAPEPVVTEWSGEEAAPQKK
ncbi:MAG TPA: type II secretion system ATPase GspE [Candidatus Sumerlaeia bacterium]|nr:type II secretion system ATPase GspE [Candidatus Sumerlaeia bacterium]